MEASSSAEFAAKGKTGYRQTLKLFRTAQKEAAPGSPPYSIYINRKVGRYLAAAASSARMTPNFVTAISALFTFSGIVMIAAMRPTWANGITVWLLLAVGYAFDSADGQLARFKGGGTLSGEWLDHVIDCLKISSLHLAVAISWFSYFELSSTAWLLVPIGFSAVASVEFFTMILNGHLKEIHALSTGARAPKSSRSWIKSVALIPTDYGLLCVVFVFLGNETLFVALYAVMFIANSLHLVAALVKWFRDLRSLDAAIAGQGLEGSHAKTSDI